MARMMEMVRRAPVIGGFVQKFSRMLRRGSVSLPEFQGSASYWEGRYALGGDSGVGSYALFAAFKAEVINAFVAEQAIGSVIEFGCGDGNQLKLAAYPSYTGFDVSQTAIANCRSIFSGDAGKTFKLMDDYAGETAELTLSLDVIYHLVEDAVFEAYMSTLFRAARRYVIVYASNSTEVDMPDVKHVRHRRFTDWVDAHESGAGWRLVRHLPNRYPYLGDYRTGSFADFYFYGRDPAPDGRPA